MKKLFFALACVIGLTFFASCDPEVLNSLTGQKPDVEFVEAEGFISSNSSFELGEPLNFQIKITPNESTQSPLTRLDFDITGADGVSVFHEAPTITDPNGENIFTFSFTPDNTSLYAVTATVNDEAGKVNATALTVDYVESIVEEIGTFKGNLNINGRIVSDEPILGNQLNDTIEIKDIVTEIMMGYTANGKVRVSLNIDGTPVSVYCTQEGNTFVFDPFIFTTKITVIAEVNLELTANISGVLEGDALTIQGVTRGSGKANIPATDIRVTLNGEINGVLDKEVE